MSKYTTGEIAKLCGVSVRTVQYYDTKNLLVPSELTEGGRRLYSDEDLKIMKIICFLREAGFPLKSIEALLSDENTENIISVLLDQQEQLLKEEIHERQKQLSIIESIRATSKELERFSVKSIGDIAHLMKNKTELKKLRALLVIIGTPVTIFFWVAVILWVTKGMWWLMLIDLLIQATYGIWATNYYYNNVGYICPECHEVFKPGMKEFFFAYHTPKMRRLTCKKCNHHGLCIEVFTGKEDSNNG
ncbi:MAG: MerR family transcriptional regulator [Acutalibacteraceae bacterium]|nr:MerR family transcriptional regulator [Acutalibacteraceae bacterium]